MKLDYQLSKNALSSKSISIVKASIHDFEKNLYQTQVKAFNATKQNVSFDKTLEKTKTKEKLHLYKESQSQVFKSPARSDLNRAETEW